MQTPPHGVVDLPILRIQLRVGDDAVRPQLGSPGALAVALVRRGVGATGPDRAHASPMAGRVRRWLHLPPGWQRPCGPGMPCSAYHGGASPVTCRRRVGSLLPCFTCSSTCWKKSS